MELDSLYIMTLGFILGLKHAIEPDHIIAVSTIASQSKKLWRSSLAGVFWGIGHTITLFTVGMVFILIKGEIPIGLAMSMEFIVGIMLIYLGLSSIFSYKKKKIHVHIHEHEGLLHSHFHPAENRHTHMQKKKNNSYLKSLLIGFIHGLAGSAAMILLTMSTVNSVFEGAIYILIFGIGTVIGMLLFTTIIGIPFVLSSGKENINQSLTFITGIVSTTFGFYYMYNLGFTEGLFKLWFQ